LKRNHIKTSCDLGVCKDLNRTQNVLTRCENIDKSGCFEEVLWIIYTMIESLKRNRMEEGICDTFI
jgi:hypothetical protein